MGQRHDDEIRQSHGIPATVPLTLPALTAFFTQQTRDWAAHGLDVSNIGTPDARAKGALNAAGIDYRTGKGYSDFGGKQAGVLAAGAGMAAAPFLLPLLTGGGAASAGAGALPIGAAGSLPAGLPGLAAGGAGAAGLGASAGATTGLGVGTGTAAAGAPAGFMAKLPRIINAGSQAAGAISQGRTQGRAAESAAANTYDRLALARYQAGLEGTSADLNQRQFLANDFQRQTQNALRGSLLQHAKDFSITPPPGVQMGTVRGGLSLDALPDRSMIGKALEDQALLELMHPTQPGSAPATGLSQRRLPSLPTLPDLTETPSAGRLDTGLNWANLLGAALPYVTGALGGATPNPSAAPAAGAASPFLQDLIARNAASRPTLPTLVNSPSNLALLKRGTRF